MTVLRKSDEIFKVSHAIVAEAARNVLEATPRYRNTVEQIKDCLFATNVKPNWWLLDTNMSISLEDMSTGTRVTVQIKSQFFVLGDVFDCYNRYIKDFLCDLNAEVEHLNSKKNN